MDRRATTHYGPDEMTDRREHEPSDQPVEAPPQRSPRKLRAAIADVTSVRAKSSRHGKSTADKWNQ